MDPVATAAALQQSFVERLTEALNRPSFFETLRQRVQPKSFFATLVDAFLRPPPGQPAMEPGQRTSFVDRLKAPTRFRRNVWLIAWVGLGAMLLLLIIGLSGRSSARSAPATQNAAVLVAPPAPPAPAPAPSPVAAPAEPPPPSAAVEPLPVEEPATDDSPLEGGSPESLARRGLGTVTVHSVATYASVYVMPGRYGKVEQPLTVPCGNKFLAIGVPTPSRKEPVWLAPGRKILIPCGGSLDVTMNPRALRRPPPTSGSKPDFNPTAL
jgi:hypothetical protein